MKRCRTVFVNAGQTGAAGNDTACGLSMPVHGLMVAYEGKGNLCHYSATTSSASRTASWENMGKEAMNAPC